MSTMAPINDSTSSSSTNLNASHLKNLLQTTNIGNYELDPHFLVLIFNIAQKNENVKNYLNRSGFFDASKMDRLDIIKHVDFFNMLSNDEKARLFPGDIFNKFINIVNKTTDLTDRDVVYIKRNANRFKDIHNYLVDNDFYFSLYANPTHITELQSIIKTTELRNILVQNSTPYAQYRQHVSSQYVKDQTETGACIDIIDTENSNQQSEKEAAEEGHWKLHISIDMERNGQTKVDTAYNIVLNLMQKYNLCQLKVVAPYENINSMKGKEFSIYLRDQMIVSLTGTEESIKRFILETEKLFLENGIIPRIEKDDANKPIAGSRYFSCRNEKARVLNEIPPIGNAIIRFGDKFAFSREGKFILSLRGDVNSLLVKPLAELSRYNIRQDQPVSTADAIRLSDDLGLNYRNNVPTVRYVSPPQSKDHIYGFLPTSPWGDNMIFISGNDAYFTENGDPIYIKTRTKEEMEELSIPTQDGDYIPAVGSEELSKILELDIQESYNPFGYSDNIFKLNTINLASNNKADEKSLMEDIHRVQAARMEAESMRNASIGNTMPAMQTHSHSQLDQIINPEPPQTKDTPMIKPPSPKKK